MVPQIDFERFPFEIESFVRRRQKRHLYQRCPSTVLSPPPTRSTSNSTQCQSLDKRKRSEGLSLALSIRWPSEEAKGFVAPDAIDTSLSMLTSTTIDDFKEKKIESNRWSVYCLFDIRLVDVLSVHCVASMI